MVVFYRSLQLSRASLEDQFYNYLAASGLKALKKFSSAQVAPAYHAHVDSLDQLASFIDDLKATVVRVSPVTVVYQIKGTNQVNCLMVGRK